MGKVLVERRKDATGEDETLRMVESGHSSKAGSAYERKRRIRSRDSASLKDGTGVKSQLPGLGYQGKGSSMRNIKQTCLKMAFYTWISVVLFSVLSLLGLPVPSPRNALSRVKDNSLVTSDEDSSLIALDRRKLSTSEESSESDEFDIFSWKSFLPESLKFPGEDEDSSDENEDEKSATEDDFDVEDLPQQVLAVQKQGNKVDKKIEKELACDEVDCVSSCVKKIKPKCAKSASCRREREKICKRRCRKQRCEDRCKDEPKFGYVEREQRMEKCKDDCTGSVAAHNKCVKRCHSQFKPCKSRCHEIASRFQCDAPSYSKIADVRTHDDEEDDEDDFDDMYGDNKAEASTSTRQEETESVQTILTSKSKRKKRRGSVSAATNI